MINIINRLISRLKNESFFLDERIPLSYLLRVVFRKFLNRINGLIIFKRFTNCFIHPSSVIKGRKYIRFGKNLSIDRFCYLDALSLEGISFGDNVSIGKYTTIECSGSLQNIGKGIVIGNNVGLGTHGFFGCAGGIKIDDNTIFGNYVSLHSENHNYKDTTIPIRLQGITRLGINIGKNCWVGAKVTILDGAIIEDGCIIAAGAVVSKGIYKENGIYAGIPAKLLKFRQ